MSAFITLRYNKLLKPNSNYFRGYTQVVAAVPAQQNVNMTSIAAYKDRMVRYVETSFNANACTSRIELVQQLQCNKLIHIKKGKHVIPACSKKTPELPRLYFWLI